jgi:hypothetical protein
MKNGIGPSTEIDEHISIGGFADKSKSTLRQISFLAVSDLTPAPQNPRKHSRHQVRAIARSIEAFGFNAPILIDRSRQIVAGHGRYEASKLLGLTQVPVVFLDHLTETQAKEPRRRVAASPRISVAYYPF